VFATKHKTHYLLALALLVVAAVFYYVAVAGHGKPRLIVIGDSLSSGHESWPVYLHEMAPRWNVQVMAQNGRTIRDFSIPRDLWTSGNSNEAVIYFLGGNDILQTNDIGFAKYRLQTHINFLLERNFKVLLIVPPTLGLDEGMFGKTNKEHRELVESYRGTRPNLWVYDIDNVWDQSETSDGCHPTASLSYEIALAMNYVLAMNIY
jgi:hypothetical protein